MASTEIAGPGPGTEHEVADLWSAIEYCHEQGWTDGLPVVPPAEELVAAFTEEAGWQPDDVLAVEPVRGREITAEKVVACAVMAGCLPSYLPVVGAALRAMSTPQYQLHGTVTSTGGAAPLIVVNGPVRDRIGLNYQGNLFGPGCRPNAAIGRAVRLVLLNCLEAVPSVLDRSTQGNFGKYSGCFAEYEEASPWEPFSVARGFEPGTSTVTVFAGESGHNLLSHGSRRPEQLLLLIADAMSALGSLSAGESLVVLAPEHAEILREQRWSRAKVQEFLYDHARRDLATVKRAGKLEGQYDIGPEDEHTWLHRGEGPQDIHLLVGGSEAGGHSAFFPSWSRVRGSLAVTVAVEEGEGA
ncbi:MAG: hypothetical protein J7518_08225 [Nocardioidaceae bacterium]|nr:hypothetical protein [Nocardioidaceae bacterium]